MWGRKTETEASNGNPQAGGSDFDAAAARVTAEQDIADTGAAAVRGLAEAADADRFEIRPEWAEAAARLCFLPAAKLSHPAYALTDEEAEKISPQIGALMQAIADKYAPALVGRVANRHPEFFDAVAAIGVLYWHKWRLVSRLLREEEAARRAQERIGADKQRPGERAEAEAFARSTVASGTLPPDSLPLRPGDRAADGSLVI
jgi:hypothetical protein